MFLTHLNSGRVQEGQYNFFSVTSFSIVHEEKCLFSTLSSTLFSFFPLVVVSVSYHILSKVQYDGIGGLEMIQQDTQCKELKKRLSMYNDFQLSN